jgi:hypothetical protein
MKAIDLHVHTGGRGLERNLRRRGGPVKITGKVSEKKVTWTFQSEYQGSPLTLKYTRTLASAEKTTRTLSVGSAHRALPATAQPSGTAPRNGPGSRKVHIRGCRRPR